MVLAVTPAQLPHHSPSWTCEQYFVLSWSPTWGKQTFVHASPGKVSVTVGKNYPRGSKAWWEASEYPINKPQAPTPQSHSWNHPQQEAGPCDSQGFPRTLQTRIWHWTAQQVANWLLVLSLLPCCVWTPVPHLFPLTLPFICFPPLLTALGNWKSYRLSLWPASIPKFLYCHHPLPKVLPPERTCKDASIVLDKLC